VQFVGLIRANDQRRTTNSERPTADDEDEDEHDSQALRALMGPAAGARLRNLHHPWRG
jgi:hypothetical protein